MNALVGFKKAVSRKSAPVFFLSYGGLWLGYFSFANLHISLSYFSYASLGFSKKVDLFAKTFFDIGGLKDMEILWLVVGVTLFGALYITLLYSYGFLRKEALKNSFPQGLAGTVALALAVVGVGCAACGAILLSGILSFFGLGGLIAYFPYHGIEIGYMGLLILLYLSYALSVRLANPYTC